MAASTGLRQTKVGSLQEKENLLVESTREVVIASAPHLIGQRPLQQIRGSFPTEAEGEVPNTDT